jgi:uncharacterized membrane protein
MRSKSFWILILVGLVAVVALVEPSFAQRTNPPAPGPAPLIGWLGLPVIAVVAGAVWLARRFGRN